MKKIKTLEQGIILLQKEAKEMPLSIGEILHILAGKGRPILLILLSLPFCQPIQIPGLSVPFGLVIAFFGLRSAFGKRVWLPKKITSKTISKPTLAKMTHTTLIVVRKIQPWIHARLNWMCSSSFMKVMNGVIIFLLGLFLALPLPIPLSNLTAAWSIFLIALGMLEDDGLFVMAGYLLTLVSIGVIIGMAYAAKAIF